MPKFLIIGGGVAGPIAALRLAQDGHECIVFERSSKPQTIGGAVNLAPNGMRLLSRLGLEHRIRDTGCTVERFDVLDESGSTLGYFTNKSKDGFKGLRIMRSSLQAISLEEAKQKNIKVLFGKNLESISEDSSGKVTAIFQDGSKAQGDYLIGADGIHSKVREYVVDSKDIKPQYANQSLVYGILPAKDLPGVDFTSMPATMGVFSRKGFFAAAFTTSTREKMYWITAQAKEESGKTEDADAIRAQESEKFKALFDPLPRVIAATNEFFSWPVFELPVLPTWIRGNVILVGDAAHALPPNQGQGVSVAIEDVFMLARIISKGAPLKRYQELREPRIAKLRAEIKSTKRERERSAFAQFLLTWVFWAFLGAIRVFNMFWEWDNFAYDVDKADI